LGVAANQSSNLLFSRGDEFGGNQRYYQALADLELDRTDVMTRDFAEELHVLPRI